MTVTSSKSPETNFNKIPILETQSLTQHLIIVLVIKNVMCVPHHIGAILVIALAERRTRETVFAATASGGTTCFASTFGQLNDSTRGR